MVRCDWLTSAGYYLIAVRAHQQETPNLSKPRNLVVRLSVFDLQDRLFFRIIIRMPYRGCTYIFSDCLIG